VVIGHKGASETPERGVWGGFRLWGKTQVVETLMKCEQSVSRPGVTEEESAMIVAPHNRQYSPRYVDR
jgi:hypothetical protein